MTRGVECTKAPEEIMVDVETVLTEGHLVQEFEGAVQVLIMGVTEALFMIGTLAHHMTGAGALIMADTEGRYICMSDYYYVF